MRKSILMYGSFLLAILTIMIIFSVKNLKANSVDIRNYEFINPEKVILQTDISECIAGIWTGIKNSDWNDPSNWCKNIVPTSAVNVIINAGGNQPIINAPAVCANITINEGATLTIANANSLIVYGDWNNVGTFTANTSTVTFGGAAQNIYGMNISSNAFYNLILAGGTKTLYAAIQINSNLLIKNGAKCNLSNFISSANSLTLGDYGQVDGEWGGSISYATYINNLYFNLGSSGKLIVATNSAPPGLWLGISSDWAATSNWSYGIIPSRETDAIITHTNSDVIINGTASCKSLYIIPGCTLEIKSSNILSVSQDWNNQGNFIARSSTVIFDGDNQSITTGNFYNLTFGGSGTKTLSNVTVSGVLSMEGTAKLSNTISYLSSATLQYNSPGEKTVGIEWPTTKISSFIIKQGMISLTPGKSLNGSPLTIHEGTKFDLKDYILNSVGAINLQCGGKEAGSIITGTKTLTLGGELTVSNSGQGTAPAVIECPISTPLRTFNIDKANSNSADPTDLLIKDITTTGILTKTGSGIMSIKGNGSLSSLVIENGNVTIQPQASVNISNNLTNSIDAKGLSILSDINGTGSLIVNSKATGSATFTRSLLEENHHLITSPLGGQSINSFLTDACNALTIQSGLGIYADYRNMRDYNPAANDWNDFFKVGTNYTTGSIIPGKGYSIKIKRSQAHQVIFTGTLPSGDISLTGLEGGYWNCIGNPYTSAIMINSSGVATTKFLENNKGNLDPAFVSVYVWDPATSPYQYTTISNATAPYNLQQGQAFMVKMAPLKTIISFNRSMQTHEVALPLKSTENVWPSIQLQVSDDSLSSATVVAFHDGMTPGLDPSYDAGLLSAGGPIELYTRLVDDYGIPFDIQALPSDQYEQLIIPVGLDYPKGGKVTFSARGMYLPTCCRPLLEDRLLGTLTDLTDTTYTTLLDVNTRGTGRFYLHTSATVLGADSPEKRNSYNAIFINHSQLRIQGKLIKNANLTLTDVIGRRIISTQIKEGDGNVINIPPVKPGTYLLNIKARDISQTLKIVYGY